MKEIWKDIVGGTYKINGDTLRTGGSVGYFLKYKKDI